MEPAMEPAIEINSISLLLFEFYDGGQWKNVASVFWDFILYSLPEIGEWYRLLYRMVGNVIRNILSFRVRKDSIDQLQLRIAEMICLWAAIFPASESYFQLHQIMDLVSSIPSFFGSAHSLSDLRVSRSAMSRFVEEQIDEEEQEDDEEQ